MIKKHRNNLVLVASAWLFLLSTVLNASSGLSIKASTDTTSVYVNAQLILTIEINTTLNLQNGTLSKPEIPGAILEPLIEDEQRDEIVNGARQVTFLRSYAVFLSKPGSVIIPSVLFEGIVSEPGMGGFNSFFGRSGKRVRAQTEAIKITVKDIPDSYPKNQPFLPLKSLALIESFEDEQTEISLNKALTRRFELRAMGTVTSFLPVIKAPKLANCEVYSESGTKTQKNSEEGILATVNFSQVYLPSEPGLVNIPEQNIYWWDTDSDQLKTTPLREFKFNVVGESNKIPPTGSSSSASLKAPSSPKELSEAKTSSQFSYWAAVAAFFCLLWLATLGFIIIRFYKNKGPKIKQTEINTEHALRAQIIKACEQNSNSRALKGLRALALYAQEHHDEKLYMQCLDCIRLLEALLYGEGTKNSPEEAFNKIKKILKETSISKPKDAPLATLYPF